MKFARFLFIILTLAVIGIAAFWYWLSISLNTGHEHSKANEYIKIEKGAPPREIISQLAAQGILASEFPAFFYLRTMGDASKLQAGDYQFKSPITALEVLKELEKGETVTTRLTIPEGFTRFDIAKRIAERFPQDPPADDKAILALMDDTSLIHDLSPEARNLEGYMYPSTYSFPKQTDARVIIKALVDQFKRSWKPEWTEFARSRNLSIHEVVTKASLIETETPLESERPIVAGVINNRLSKGIPLGIDQTNVYIAKMLGRWDGTINKSDLEVNSPYNTRIKPGLPPGPISSVTASSINAALNPASHDYIYYVLNVEANDGSHWFYSSAAEFEKGKARYQQWLEKERQLKREADANNQN
jgi:UPF0755 protein